MSSLSMRHGSGRGIEAAAALVCAHIPKGRTPLQAALPPPAPAVLPPSLPPQPPSTFALPPAGGVARGLAAIVSCPITVVKTQMEYTGAGAPQYTGTAHALASITRERGLQGLFSGVGPTLLANAPFSAIYYVFYTQLQVGGLLLGAWWVAGGGSVGGCWWGRCVAVWVG